MINNMNEKLEKYFKEGRIILLDKPSGVTSFSFINKYKRDIGAKKIGHAGTLDPQATGLMLVAINENTKILGEFVGLNKKYVANITLGTKTDSGDKQGKIIKEKEIPNLKKENIEEVLKSLIGNIELPVSNFSAMKYQGKSRHEYARAGIEIPEVRRVMEIFEANLISFEDNIVTAEFFVGSGTYIRSIAEYVGEKLGTVAHLSALRRTTVGPFELKS